MSIGNRLILFLSVPIIGVMILFGFLSQRESRALLQIEMVREGRAVARIAQITLEDYLRDHQLQDARELIDEITGYERVLGVQLFDPEGRLVYQSRTVGAKPLIPGSALVAALREHRMVEVQWRVDDEPVLGFIVPLAGPNGEPAGAAQVLQLATFLAEAQSASRRSVVTLTIIMILATAAVIILVTRRSVARPVADLVARLRGLGGGDLSARVPVRRSDELGRLAYEVNVMAERLEVSRRELLEEQERRQRTEAGLRQAERLASVGRLAAGLAHEIGTPLNVIGGRAEALQRRLADHEEARRGLGIIAAQIDRISRIVRGMLDFARAREVHLSPTSVATVVRKSLDLLEHRIRESGVVVAWDVPDDLPRIIADADQIHQVFLNLATNALDAMPRGGRLGLRARQVASGPGSPRAAPTGEAVDIVFEDTGDGIPAEHLPRVFDPFFTTKEAGRGTGLGLSVSYGIVREHGGTIEAENIPGAGARFTVRLPISGPQVAAMPSMTAAGAP